MDLKGDTLSLFILLLPGFVSSTLLDVFTPRRSKDVFARVVEALVFSFVIYACLVGVFGYPIISIPTEVQKIPAAIGTSVNGRFVLGALVLSLVLPLILGWLIASDFHMKVLRALGVTHRSSRDTVWLDVFIEQKRYVIVNLSGQRRIFGWPRYFSEDSSGGLLYLQDPEWIRDDGTYDALNVHGILLVEPNSIESIEFTNVDEYSAKAEGDADDQSEAASA